METSILKENITHQPLPGLGLKLRFAAVDLAPNEQLETGFSVLDRDRNLIRIDKFYKDDEVLSAIESLGPANGTIVVIDVPKSLSIPGRWRQEQVKMHAQRLVGVNGKPISRFDKRGIRLYEALEARGVLAFLYFNYWTRLNYGIQVPFRSRSPQGCRALQMAIEHQLDVKNLPTNLAASSVLESMVGAYAGWAVWMGQPETDYEIFRAETGQRVLIPGGRPHLGIKPSQRRRRFRREVPMPFRNRKQEG